MSRQDNAPDVQPNPRPPQPSQPSGGPRLSVMEWLVDVGHVVAHRLRGVPRSPMIRLYPKG